VARALRRSERPLRAVAFLGDTDGDFARRVLRALPAPEEGAVAVLVEARERRAMPPGWSTRALGMPVEGWLADRTGARVDAIVAWRVLHMRSEAGRRELLDHVPRRAALFVACEPAAAFAAGAITAAWPQWHSCVIRESRWGWWAHGFEARSL